MMKNINGKVYYKKNKYNKYNKNLLKNKKIIN